MKQELRIRNKKFKPKSIIHNSLFIIRKSEGFTLIELLIATIIIGVLATIFMSNFIGVRQRARDSQRKSDLRQIHAALELIRSNKDSYPASLYSVGGDCPTSSSLQAGTPAVIYMKKIPCDPKPPPTGGFTNGNYVYSNSSNGYSIGACIENVNDTDPSIVTTLTIVCPLRKLYTLTNP